VPLRASVTVARSPIEGYRMRARLHRRGRHLGFFREGTHELCDARQTRQLLPATCDVVDALGDELVRLGMDEVTEVELAENADASERVVHLHTLHPSGLARRGPVPALEGVTGLTVSTLYGGCRVLSGSPHVTDRVEVRAGPAPSNRAASGAVAVRRHVLAFFQGNRFLVHDLVAHVVEQVPIGSTVVDLYAGGGLFAVAAARARQARVTAVEGDKVGADDLIANAVSTDGVAVRALHQSVEVFVRSASEEADVVIVDPPRTGVSLIALDGVLRLAPRRVVYVSCDVATLARDARRLVAGGYRMASIEAFDLFPVTPHVEAVVVFEK
jgi:tRNA/tmRNA/rRNA uracil-C5-methylase (TrmA/RlmC/RlmD family)